MFFVSFIQLSYFQGITVNFFFFEDKICAKLKSCSLDTNEWNTVDKLCRLIAPFNYATKLIQTDSFQTLAVGKAIESILSIAFKKFCEESVDEERLLATRLNESIQYHLKHKIKAPQRRAT